MTQGGLPKCDFCGRRSAHVRRIALDRGYDRLGPGHSVRYACRDCSREKEARRTGALDASAKRL